MEENKTPLHNDFLELKNPEQFEEKLKLKLEADHIDIKRYEAEELLCQIISKGEENWEARAIILLTLGVNFHPSLLHIAIARNSINLVRKLLECKVPFTCDREGDSPLHQAIKAMATKPLQDSFSKLISDTSDIKILKIILKHTTEDELNQANYYGLTPLHFAVLHNVDPTSLLKYGARTDIADSDLDTVLHLVIPSEPRRKKLLKNGIRSSTSIPIEQVIAIVKTLLHYGADPQKINSQNKKPSDLVNDVINVMRATDQVNKLLGNAKEDSDIGKFKEILKLLENPELVSRLPENVKKLYKAICRNEDPAVTNFTLEDAKASEGQTPLQIALAEGSKDWVIELYKMVDIFHRSKLGRSTLYYLALSREPDFIKLLKLSEIPADQLIPLITEYSDLGLSPYSVAIINKFEELTKFFYSLNPPINPKNKLHLAPAHAAAMIGNYTLLEALIQNKADVNNVFRGKSILFTATEEKHAKCVWLLLEYNAKITPNPEGVSALWLAARQSQKSLIFKKLLGAATEQDVLRYDNRLNTLLHYLAMGGILENLLLTYEASKKHLRKIDINALNDRGQSALMLAAMNQNLDFIQFLVAHGANPFIEDIRGISPYFLIFQLLDEEDKKSFSEFVESEIIKNEKDLLIKFNRLNEFVSDKNVLFKILNEFVQYQDKWDKKRYGRIVTTALHELIKAENILKLKQFLADNSEKILNNIYDLNVKDINGNTPLNLACRLNLYEAVSHLLKSGANPNTACTQGQTPLHHAMENKNVKILKVLLEHKAKPYEDSLGNKPDWPGISNDITMLEILLDTYTPEQRESPNRYGFYLTHVAASVNNAALLSLLLNKYKLDPNKLDFQGKVPTFNVVSGHKESMFVNGKKHTKSPELDQTNQIACLEVLIKSKVDLFHRNLKGELIIYHMVEKNLLEVVKYLLSDDSRNQLILKELEKDKEILFPPQHIAASENLLNMIIFLVSKGFDFNALDFNQHTVLEVLLTQKKHTNIVRVFRYLISHVSESTIHSNKWNKFTLLHFAAYRVVDCPIIDILRLIKEHSKIDINSKSENGCTPFLILFDTYLLEVSDLEKNKKSSSIDLEHNFREAVTWFLDNGANLVEEDPELSPRHLILTYINEPQNKNGVLPEYVKSLRKCLEFIDKYQKKLISENDVKNIKNTKKTDVTKKKPTRSKSKKRYNPLKIEPLDSQVGSNLQNIKPSSIASSDPNNNTALPKKKTEISPDELYTAIWSNKDDLPEGKILTDPNITYYGGTTAFILTVCRRNMGLFFLLYNLGADVTRSDSLGTALHYAARKDDSLFLKMILKKNSHDDFINKKNTFGQTAYDVAEKNNFKENMNLLKKDKLKYSSNNNVKKNISPASHQNCNTLKKEIEAPLLSTSQAKTSDPPKPEPLFFSYILSQGFILENLKNSDRKPKFEDVFETLAQFQKTVINTIIKHKYRCFAFGSVTQCFIHGVDVKTINDVDIYTSFPFEMLKKYLNANFKDIEIKEKYYFKNGVKYIKMQARWNGSVMDFNMLTSNSEEDAHAEMFLKNMPEFDFIHACNYIDMETGMACLHPSAQKYFQEKNLIPLNMSIFFDDPARSYRALFLMLKEFRKVDSGFIVSMQNFFRSPKRNGFYPDEVANPERLELLLIKILKSAELPLVFNVLEKMNYFKLYNSKERNLKFFDADGDGNTPLHHAVIKRDIKKIANLLTRGYPPKFCNNRGEPAIPTDKGFTLEGFLKYTDKPNQISPSPMGLGLY